MIVTRYPNGISIVDHGDDSKPSDYTSLRVVSTNHDGEPPCNVLAKPQEYYGIII